MDIKEFVGMAPGTELVFTEETLGNQFPIGFPCGAVVVFKYLDSEALSSVVVAIQGVPLLARVGASILKRRF